MGNTKEIPIFLPKMKQLIWKLNLCAVTSYVLCNDKYLI